MREMRGVLMCLTQVNYIISFSLRPETFGKVIYQNFNSGSIELSSEIVFLG